VLIILGFILTHFMAYDVSIQ